ncbi:hypothetical protein JCM10296v2_005917 [Rhodotorula toruloides]
MAPSVLPQYAPLAGASTTSLPLHGRPRDEHVSIPGRLDTELDDEDGERDEGDVEDDAGGETGRTGLLSGRDKEDEDEDAGADDLEEEGRRLTGAETVQKRRRRVTHWRLVLLGCVALGSVVLVVAIFRPPIPFLSSPSPSTLPSLSASDATYYSGQALAAGVYAPDFAHVAANPLPSDQKYGDVPFAQVGQSWDKSGKTPTWAGGDWGEKELEGELGEGGGRRWNGTHWWDPTVILISLDGVRADYLERGLTPHLLNISRKGIRAQYMEPSFPSLTFPNHWTLLTGLYPSSHGIVANDFYDPELGKEFVYTEPGKSWGSEWWGGEPIWATASKASLRSAVLMWPGPPVMQDGTKPTYWYPFVARYHHRKKVQKVAGWLDMDYTHRPHLMAVYLPEVDQAGHKTGPDSRTTEKTLAAVDEFVREVFEELERRNLSEVVDVVVVSDHGMAATSNKRLIFLDDILGPSGFASISHIDGWTSAGLRFKPGTDVPALYARLEQAAEKEGSGFKCYDQESMVERWHFTGHERISPIYCVPDVGWAITNHHELEVVMNGTYSVKGNHGYDPADPSMHAIFVAHGPFASSLKNKSRSRLSPRKSPTVPIPSDPNTLVVPAFKNTEDTLAATASIWSRLPNEEKPTTRGRLSPSSRSTDSHSSGPPTHQNGLKPPHSLAPHSSLQPAHPLPHAHSHAHATEFVPSPRSSVSSSSFSATPESSNSPRDRLAGSKGLAPPPSSSSTSATRFSSPQFASSLGLYQEQATGAVSDYAAQATNGQAAVPATSRGPTSPPPASNQPLLAEIFSGNPRPHYRPSLSTSALSPHQQRPSHSSTSPRSDSGAALTSPPIVPEGRSYFAPPPPDSAHGRARSHSIAGIEKPATPMNLRGGPPPAAGAADQHGFRHSSTLTSAGGHFSASLPTTSAVGSPTYAHSAFTPGPPSAASNRDLSASPSRPAYSPFDSSTTTSSGWKPSGNSGLSHSFSAGWNDEVGSAAGGAREGRSRFRDQWASSGASGTALSTSASSAGGGGGIGMSNMSPFSRDGARLLPDLPSPFGGPGSSSLTSGEWSGLGGSAAYKSRREYALGAVGSGRKRSDSAWARSALHEAEEDLEGGGDESLHPPTKSGATSRRHSFAAFEPPSRGSTMQLGFHLPEEPAVGGGGGFGPLVDPAPASNGWGGGRRLGSSAINDDDLAADLNSLHLNLEAHAATQDERKTRFALVGSMPADFPPKRSSRALEQSRSPPPPPQPPVSQQPTVSLPPPVPSSSSTLSTATATPTPYGQTRTSPRPSGDSFNTSLSTSAASRFFQGLPAPTPLPPATTTATATATASPGLGASSRFGFDQQQRQQRGAHFGCFGGLPPPVPPPTTQHPFFAPATTTGPLSPRGSAAFPPVPPPPFPGFGPGVSPAIPPPHLPGQHYAQQQPQQHQPIPPPASYFNAPPPPPPPVLAQQPGAPSLTTQAQGDINLGRGVPLHAIPPDAPLCIVGFKAGRKDLFFCEDPNLHLEEGDLVIVEADRGRDVGKYLKSCTVDEVHKFQQHLVELALGQLANPAAQGAQGGMMGGLQGMGGMGGGAQGAGAGGAAGPAQLARMTKECQPKRIYGKAGPADTHALLAKAQDEVKALALVRSKVAQKGLPMEILDAEWQWDRRKLTFYYTADQRVDFRELVRELFRIWKTRVWLCCLDQQQPSFDLV